MHEQIRQAVENFGKNPVMGGQMLRQLLAADVPSFLESSLPLLKSGDNTPGHRYLATLLIQNELLLEELSNPAAFTSEEAIALAQQAMRVEPLLDTKLARKLPGAQGATPGVTEGPEAERILEILDAISDGPRVVSLLAHLIHNSNPRLRSKAALFIGRRVQNFRWTEQHLQAMDPRVRANAIQAIWGVDSTGARTLLWGAIKDTSNRAAGNAMFGLHTLAEQTVIPRILEMAASSKPGDRSTAAWVMSQTGSPRFLPTLTPLLRDPEPSVRGNVFKAVSAIKHAAARSKESGLLQVRILRTESLADGSGRVWVTVRALDGSAVTGLGSTNFIVWDGSGAPIADYNVTEHHRPETLIVGFGLCRETGVPEQDARLQDQAVLRCLGLKRNTDQWAVTKLMTARDVTLNSVEESARYGANADLLKSDIVAPAQRASDASLLGQSMRTLIAGFANLRGSRHVVMLGCTAPTDNAVLEPLAKAATAARVAVHALGYSGHPLEGICHSTGGTFVSASSPDQVSDALETLYFGLLNRYTVAYRAETTADTVFPGDPVRLQIYSAQGFGEEILPLS